MSRPPPAFEEIRIAVGWSPVTNGANSTSIEQELPGSTNSPVEQVSPRMRYWSGSGTVAGSKLTSVTPSGAVPLLVTTMCCSGLVVRTRTSPKASVGAS